jgi:uncharacterized protein (DUF2141 family)
MKLAALAIAATAAFAGTVHAAETVTVSVKDVESRGDLYASLYDERGFKRSDPVAVARAEREPGTLTLNAPSPGRYVVRVYQDEDRDGKPTISGRIINEPVGYSNGAGSRRERPSFSDASIDVPAGGVTIEIDLD